MMQAQTGALSSRGSPTPPSVLGGDLFSHTKSACQPDRAAQLIAAAEGLLAVLCRGNAPSAPVLRRAMVAMFGGSDAEGAWGWKVAYDAYTRDHLIQVLDKAWTCPLKVS